MLLYGSKMGFLESGRASRPENQAIREEAIRLGLGKLDCFSQNTFGVIEWFADRAINVIAAANCFAANRTNTGSRCFAQGPQLFGIVTQP